MALKFLNSGYFADKVGIGTDSLTKNLNLEWNSSSVNPQTGENLAGGGAGKGVLLRNSNTTAGTFVNLDFRANNADARIAYTHNATNNGDFHFILDNTTASPLTRLFIEGETGNVGIGTTSPNDKLDVTDGNSKMVFGGASSDRPLLYFQHNAVPVDGEEVGLLDFRGYNDASQDTRYVILTAKAEDVTDGSEDGSLTFQTMKAGTATSTLNLRSGNVGIGTTSPSAPLHVFKSSHPNAMLARFENPAGEALVEIKAQNDALSILQFADSEDGNVGGIQYSHVDNSMRFKTNDTEKMRITSTGNVGIGTTIPVGKLYVGPTWDTTYGGNDLYIKSTGVDNSSYDPQVANTSDLGITYVTTSTNTSGPDKVGLTLFNNDNTAGTFSPMLLFAKREAPSTSYKATMAGIYARSPLGTGNNTSWIDGELIFATAGMASQGIKQRMVINKEGKVGIGTTSPQDALDIDWDTDGVATDRSGIRVRAYRPHLNLIDRSGYSTSNGHNFQIKADVAKLQFNATSADDETFDLTRMVIDKDGNVGIGATSPTATLDVNDDKGTATNLATTKTAAGFDLNSNTVGGSNSLTIGETNQTSYFLQHANSAGTTAYDIAINPYGGNVGIGTASPGTKVHIQNPNKIDDAYGLLLVENTNTTATSALTNTGINVKNREGTSQFMQWEEHGLRIGSRIITNDGVGDVIFTAGADSEKMRIKAGGNVGIGTTSPGAKLNVAGDVLINASANSNSLKVYRGALQTLSLWNATNGAILSLSSDTVTNSISLDSRANQKSYINTGGNVGIGTTSPARNVHIHADTNTDLHLTNTASGATGTDGGTLTLSGLDLLVNNRESGNLRLYTAGAEKMRITSTGNVGIGTTSPNAKLEVYSGTLNNQLYLVSPDTGQSGINFGGTTAKTKGRISYSDNSDAMSFNTASSERMRISSNGNVGIGTTSPAAKLEVVSTTTIAYNPNAYNSGSILTLKSPNANTNYSSIRFSNSAGNYEKFIGSVQTGTNTADIVFQGYDRGAGVYKEYARIAENGNVGIGTITPGSLLQVGVGTSNSPSVIASLGGSANNIMSALSLVNVLGNNAAGQGVALDFHVNAAYSPTGRIATIAESTGTPAALAFYTYSSGLIEKMRITSSGNVGIGTTSPNSKFQIKVLGTDGIPVTNADTGTISFGSVSSTATASILGRQTASTTGLWIGAATNNANGAGDMEFNVRENNNSTFSTLTNSAFKFSHYSTSLLTILRNGNVGIGTTNPSAKLEINAGGNAAGLKMIGSSTSYTAAFIGNTGTGNAGVYYDANNGDFAGGDYGFIGQDNTGHMLYDIGSGSPAPYHVFTGGNVGIGTTSPDAKLDVAGDAIIRGATLSGNTFSDPDLVLSVLDTDNTESLRQKMSVNGTLYSAITKVSDSTAPAPGAFQVSGAAYPQGFGPSYTIEEGDTFTFEFWIKWHSGTATSNLLYAGSNFYDASGVYLGNSYRYWGEAALNINSNSGSAWRHVSGTLGPGRANSTHSIPTAAVSMKLLFLFNYAANGTVVTRYCGLKVYKSGKTVTQLYRKTIGSEAGLERHRNLVVDANGDIYGTTGDFTSGIARTNQGGSTTTGIKFWSGSAAAYAALTPDANTIYYVT